MRKNPFSLYDFLGYVFPGLIALYLVFVIASADEILSVSDFFRSLRGINMPFNLENTIILTVSAYLVGHILALLSSLTVERFAIWVYDYPSKFLLGRVPNMHFWQPVANIGKGLNLLFELMPLIYSSRGAAKKFHKNLKLVCRIYIEFLWRIVIAIFLMPLTVCTLIFGKFLGFKTFFVKELDPTLKGAIRKSIGQLAFFLGIKVGKKDDVHRIVYHYEYELQKAHSVKMDNYIALYGFLRALTLIFNLLFIWFFFVEVVPTLDMDSPVDSKLAILMTGILGLCYLCFIGFMKFYRRFSLETFMCLVVDTSYKQTSQIPLDFKYTLSKTASNPVLDNAEYDKSTFGSSREATAKENLFNESVKGVLAEVEEDEKN
ncbi:MAG: hypothetical protein NC453_20000 [Muribaculum sp.]|nr:hypothetical protein [Muribaculum sp.]